MQDFLELYFNITVDDMIVKLEAYNILGIKGQYVQQNE